MIDITSQFLLLLQTNEEFQKKLKHFNDSMQKPEFEFMKACIRTVQGRMLEHMLSKEFTFQDDVEKDVIQRTYFYTNQMLEFLIHPAEWVKKKSKWRKFSEGMGNLNPKNRKET